MKIRCGSHQQNRSIVRPGLSLMATKVALTAEEFRENSQRSIDLFNTEKLSTDSTHVLKSAYCNSVHFCRCNLHGACGGKGHSMHTGQARSSALQSARSVWRQSRLFPVPLFLFVVAICTERVEAKPTDYAHDAQSSVAICTERVEAKFRATDDKKLKYRCNLHGACGGKATDYAHDAQSSGCNLHGACGGKVVWLESLNGIAVLQSARSVWRQRVAHPH